MKCFPILLTVCVSTLAFAELPSKEQILNSMQDNFTWNESYSMQVLTRTAVSTQGGRYRKQETIVRKDGKKTEWLEDSFLYDENDNLGNDTFQRIRLITPEKDYYVTKAFGRDKYHGTVAGYDPKEQTRWADQHGYGTFLDRNIAGFGDVIEGLKNTEVSITEGVIDGITSIVLEAETPQGKFIAWLDPTQGYSFLKYTFEITPKDLWYGKPLEESNLQEILITVDNIKVQKIGNIYIPVKGTYQQRTLYKDGKEKITRLDVLRKQIDFNPDFEKMGAFKLNIPDGSILFDRKVSQIPYEWINGRLVPYIDDVVLEDLDRMARELGVSYIKPPMTKQSPTMSTEAPAKSVFSSSNAVEVLADTVSPEEKTKGYKAWWIGSVAVLLIFFGGRLVIGGNRK